MNLYDATVDPLPKNEHFQPKKQRFYPKIRCFYLKIGCLHAFPYVPMLKSSQVVT